MAEEACIVEHKDKEDGVDSQDISRLYEIIDPMRIDIAEIKTTLKLLPKPEARPCPYLVLIQDRLNAHLSEKIRMGDKWSDTLISATVDLVKMILVGLFVFWVLKH